MRPDSVTSTLSPHHLQACASLSKPTPQRITGETLRKKEPRSSDGNILTSGAPAGTQGLAEQGLRLPKSPRGLQQRREIVDAGERVRVLITQLGTASAAAQDVASCVAGCHVRQIGCGDLLCVRARLTRQACLCLQSLHDAGLGNAQTWADGSE